MEYLEVVGPLRECIMLFAGVVLVVAIAGQVWLGWMYDEIVGRVRASVEELERAPLRKAA